MFKIAIAWLLMCLCMFVIVDIAQSLGDHLEWQFPQQTFLDAFRIINLQYWQQEGTSESFY